MAPGLARVTIPLFLVISVILFPYYVAASAASPSTCDSVALIVYNDGGVWVNENLTVTNAPSNITVSLLATPLTLYAEDQNGVPLPVSYSNTTAIITVYGPGKIILRYYTLGLTSKTGYSWKLSFTAQCPAIVVLPGDAVPVRVEPTPSPTLYKGQAALRFPSGEKVLVEYYIIPGGAPQPSATTSQPPSITSTYNAGTQSSQAPIGTKSPNTSTSNTGMNKYLWAIIIALLAVFAGFAYLQRTRRVGGASTPSQASVETLINRLDERDRSILEALRERPMTAVELQQVTGIPKTPLYRRLKRLLDEGLIEYYEENGVRVYKLKKQL